MARRRKRLARGGRATEQLETAKHQFAVEANKRGRRSRKAR